MLTKILSSKNRRNFTLIFVILILVVIFSFVSKGFLSVNNFVNILRQSSGLALAALAMTLIIVTGGIDLSVGAVIAFSGATGAYVMQAMSGVSPILVGIVGMLVTILTAVLFGMLNGFIVAYFRIAPFIVTLATMSLARGLTMVLLQSVRILVDNNLYNAIGQHWFGPFPLSVMIAVGAFAVGYYLLNFTYFGRKTYSTGDSWLATKASGINPRFHQFKVYAISGLFVGLAAILITGRSTSAQPFAGLNMEFEVITAVVIGGTSLAGGVGDLKGTMLGVLLTASIFTGLSMVNLPPFINYIAKGLLILVAVLSNQFVQQRKVKSSSKEQVVDKSTSAKDLIKNNEQETLVISNISKSFPGVQALDQVSLQLNRGEVHAIVGENGAGKSTLMKIISGVYQKDEGQLLIDQVPLEINSAYESQELGIATIFQELSAVKDLTVWQNINLGREETNVFGAIDKKLMKIKALETLKIFNLEDLLNYRMGDLSVGQQQMIEIAKAISANAWLIIMDEPTSAISEEDSRKLFEVIERMKQDNIAVVYISHKMDEIFEISDTITILRDGHHIITGPTNEFNEDSVIRHMVGRKLTDIYDKEVSYVDYDNEILRVENLSRKGSYESVGFSLYKGEVLGFSGLMGAGRTEIMRSLFGLDSFDQGKIYLDGQPVKIRNTSDAIKLGIAMVSEDRRTEGILPNMNISENTTIVFLKKLLNYLNINKKKEKDITSSQIDKLNIRTPSTEQLIKNLSGGNQQKVCLSKWLIGHPRIIILDEPTKGIDIGAKAEIHKFIHDLTEKGISVILVSSELTEVIGAADRVIVLYQGEIAGEFDNLRNKVSQEVLIKAASGL